MTDVRPGARPVIRHNDYSPLAPPPVGGWRPALPVSVVVPAHGGQDRLDLTLAALAAQTYPAHLLEVVVVDDGSEPPLRLPEIAPADTRVVTADPSGWGIGHALNAGAAVAGGVLIQRLDADMVVCREHIETMARWHHLTDFLVTIGTKRFVERADLTPERVHQAVRDGALEAVFDWDAALPSSTEATIAKLDGLRASRNPYHVCTGPTICLHRGLFHAAGGVDPEVPRGEDTEFAYRLAQAGAVFVPDGEARAIHLGLPGQRVDRERTLRVAAPYLAHRIPLRRDLRKDGGRHWKVPYVEVVLPVEGADEQAVLRAAAAAFAGSVADVVVTLVAPWSALPDGRRPVLADPLLDLRLMREHLGHDERVRFADAPAPTPAPVPFRYTGPVDTPLGRDTLKLMIEAMQQHRAGVVTVGLPSGATARLERTEALSRALLLNADTVDETIEATHGLHEAPHTAFWPPTPSEEEEQAVPPTAQPPALPRAASPRTPRDGLLRRLRRFPT